MRLTSPRSTPHLLLGLVACSALLLTSPGPTTRVPVANGTFTQDVPITIEDGSTSPYPSELLVSGLPKGILFVSVGLKGLAHASPDDMDVLLVSPAGGRMTILSDVGGTSPAAGVNLTLDDQAVGPMPDETALVSGTYRPTNMESGDSFPAPAPDPFQMSATTLTWSFQYGDPNGIWKLFVVDDTPNDGSGSLAGWSLQIRTVDPPPAPVVSSPSSGTADSDGTVVLTGAARNASKVFVFEGDTEVASAAPFNDGFTVSVPNVSEGSHTFIVRSYDEFYRNTSPPSAPVTVVVDRVAPSAALSINQGAASTNRTRLRLSLAGSDPSPGSGVAQMRFSNDGTTYSAFEPFALTKDWDLPARTNGTRTIWVQVADRAGHVSAAAADAIRLDTVKPRVTTVRPARGATGVPAAANVKARFGEAVDTATLTRTRVSLVPAGTTKAVRARLTYHPTTRTVTLDPRRNLRPGTTYRVLVTTRVTDLATNPLDQKPGKPGNQRMTWRFTTN